MAARLSRRKFDSCFLSLWHSKQLLESTGVRDGRELLAPLVVRTAANWAQLGPAALTGPIARGDERTVARHLEAIEAQMPELLDLYRALADRTRALAEGEVAA